MNSLYKAFGLLVRAARMESCLTQEDLGKRVGLSRTAITNIEKGNQGVTLLQLYELAARLKTHPKELLPSEGLDVLSRTSAHVQELVAQESDQELLIKMMKGRKNASRS